MEEWTPNLLKALFEQRFADSERAVGAAMAAYEKAVAAALNAADRAVLKAELAAEKRFEGVNEFRGAMADQQAKLMPRQEAAVEFANLREKYDTLAARFEALALQVGSQKSESAGMARFFGYIVTGVALLGGILAIVFRFVK